MLKKLSMAASLLLLAGSAVADFAPAPYIGGGLGIVTHADSHFGVFRGLPLRVFAGYGGTISQSRFYLAGEVGATLVTGELVNSSYGLASDNGYMVSLLPGVLLNDNTLAFLRTAGVKTWFKDPREASSGFQFGLGLETSVYPNVSVRAEYDITLYSDLHRIGQHRSPRSDGGNFDVIYKFG